MLLLAPAGLEVVESSGAAGSAHVLPVHARVHRRGCRNDREGQRAYERLLEDQALVP
jgi:hypothetical protein